MNNEPTLMDMDDYNGNESKDKRKIIWLVVISALVVGAIFAYFGRSSVKSDILQTVPKQEANSSR